MNPVQSSAQPKTEAPGTATAPRDYNFAADILKRNLDAGRADRIAFIDHRGKYSYADLADRVERFGHVLRGLGVRTEERVLICLLDTIDWPTAFLGAIKAGVVAVPVNTLMTEDDYRFMLEDSRARLLVVSEELLPKFRPAIAASKSSGVQQSRACHCVGRRGAWAPSLRRSACGGRQQTGHGVDCVRRHVFLALHFRLNRPAERRRAHPRRSCAHR